MIVRQDRIKIGHGYDINRNARRAPDRGAVLQIQWGPIIAGGIAAAALALVLHSFAVAIGLSVSSTAPTWRDASIALVLLSGLYLLLAAIVSYGFGGYLAGRMRPRLRPARRRKSNSGTASTGF